MKSRLVGLTSQRVRCDKLTGGLAEYKFCDFVRVRWAPYIWRHGDIHGIAACAYVYEGCEGGWRTFSQVTVPTPPLPPVHQGRVGRG